MKICGFLQNYNCVENGFLENCLISMSNICDYIVVYDDASTEDVRPIYNKYNCVVIYGHKNEFYRELQHKQELLTIALRENPDWICWFDSDAILGKDWESYDDTRESLVSCDEKGIVLLHLHNLNLWKSDRFYRTDESFNDLWHGVFWKNTGELHYVPVPKLHQKQYPRFYYDQNKEVVTSKYTGSKGQLIHLGFSRTEEIVKKYFTYRELGQEGWALNRLVDETNLSIEHSDAEWLPSWFEQNSKEEFTLQDGCFGVKELAEISSYDHWKRVCYELDRKEDKNSIQ